MAHRRMINQNIVDTDYFAGMSLNARYLYYELLIRADDDGFLGAPMRVVGMVGCEENDLHELVANGYIIKFDTGIIVIRDWKIHNRIRKDMYKKTIYQTEFGMLAEIRQRYYLKDSTDVTDNVTCNVTDNVTDNVTLGKDSLGKDSLGKFNYQLIADMYNEICISFPKVVNLSDTRKKAIKARLKKYSLEDIKRVFEIAEGSSFLKGGNSRNWSANFDWMMKDANIAKILDGNYSDRKELPVPEEYHAVDPEFSEIVRNYKPSPDDPFQ